MTSKVGLLSGGQRQRVWIALALAQQTDILLLDEPTTYLDIAYQVEILDLLTDLNKKRNTTILMVLHDINLSARYADYIFAMYQGQLEAQGAPLKIITPGLIKKSTDWTVRSFPIRSPVHLLSFPRDVITKPYSLKNWRPGAHCKKQ